MASRLVYTPVSTEDASPPLLSDKEEYSDDESADYRLVRRNSRLAVLHWVAHGLSLAVIVVLALRIWDNEPLQSRCHKLFNYYCMVAFAQVVHKWKLINISKQHL